MFQRNFLLTTVVALSLSSGAAIAQPFQSSANTFPEADTMLLAQGGKRDGELLEKLNLSDSQKQTIQNMRSSHRTQMETPLNNLRQAQTTMKSLLQNGNTSRSQLESQYRTIASLRRSIADLKFQQMMDLRDVLTPAQREEFTQHMAQQQGSSFGNHKENGFFSR